MKPKTKYYVDGWGKNWWVMSRNRRSVAQCTNKAMANKIAKLLSEDAEAAEYQTTIQRAVIANEVRVVSDLYEYARSIQRTNYAARRLYLIAAGVSLLIVVGALLLGPQGRAAGIALGSFCTVFFLGLAAFNERLIRKMRKAGIK